MITSIFLTKKRMTKVICVWYTEKDIIILYEIWKKINTLKSAKSVLSNGGYKRIGDRESSITHIYIYMHYIECTIIN